MKVDQKTQKYRRFLAGCLIMFRPGFFSLRLKNSRSQKLKLKVFKAQTQEFLVQKLKKSETLGAILAQKFKIPMKIDVLEEILTNLSKTQGFFHNSSPKSLKNSRFRKVHLLALPKKRLKKSLKSLISARQIS